MGAFPRELALQEICRWQKSSNTICNLHVSTVWGEEKYGPRGLQ